MSTRSRAALAVWRGRNVRTAGDRGYFAYLVLMVALVAVAPVARAIWLSATGADGIALFSSPAAPHATVLVVAVLWASGLLLGRDRGPAVLPPFLTYALVTSDLSRSDTLRGPVIRAGALVTTVTTSVAGLVGASLMSNGLAEPLGVVTFTLAGALVGVIATVAWLAGEAFPRAAGAIALGVVALAVAAAFVPGPQSFTPWGWVGALYPGGSSPQALAALFAWAAALVAAGPMLLNRIDHGELAAQASRWDSATSHATGMDFSTAASVYRRRPHAGRRVGAVSAGRGMPVTFLIRDAIGATRTPGRLIVGAIAVFGAGALMTFAFAPGSPGWVLGAAAGLVLFAGLGPLTDGVRHAASVASDLPLYGISDESLLANHLLFPAVVIGALLLAAVVVCATLIGVGVLAPALSAVSLGLLALVARVNDALKGPLPVATLAPVPTPMGDVSAGIRMAWALDAPLLAAAAGASAALVLQAPVLLAGVAVLLAAVGVNRWRRRG